MPSHGDKSHEYLKCKALEKLVKIYGDKIDIIKNEQPKVGAEQNFFKVSVNLGSAWHDRFGASVMHFPDMWAQIRLNDSEKKVIMREREKLLNKLDSKERYGMMERIPVPDVRILIVECETQQSGLVNGNLSRRYHGYKLIQIQHLLLFTFILATFKDVKVKTDLFDVIWRFPRCQ